MQTTFSDQIKAIRFARTYLAYRADLMDQTGADSKDLRKQDQALNDAVSSIFALSLQEATENKDLSGPLAAMDAIHESATAEITLAKSDGLPSVEDVRVDMWGKKLPILHIEGFELRQHLVRNHIKLYSKLLDLSRKGRVKISREPVSGSKEHRLRLEVGIRVFYEDEGRHEPYKAYDRLLESISKL